MRVLLIDPAGKQRRVTHNAGLAFLSSALLKRGHDVRVLDLNNYAYTDEEISGYARRYEPDWIGASVKTALVDSAEKTVGLIKTAYPRAHTIIGGPHISVLGSSYLSHQHIYEFGLIGEGECAFPDLIEGKDPSHIPGLLFHEGGEWHANPCGFIFDLDSLHYPTYRAWDRIDRSLFPYLMVHSRGCPFRCTFCSVPRINGRKFRKRSPESVIDELHHARSEYVFRDFEFIDDNLTLDVHHAKRLCEALIQADLHVGWYANNGIRADRLDAELAQLMKKSGCKGVAIGIESADDEILKAVKKSETLEQMTRGITLLKSAGIAVGGHFIIGLPGDTLEKVQKSLAFKDAVGLDYAYFNQLVPYPGTEVNDWAKNNGKILVDNIANTNHFGNETKIIMETPEFPKYDRERALLILARDFLGGKMSCEDFQKLYGDQPALRVLVIRSGRMDPYGHILSLLPQGSFLDVLVSHGVCLEDLNINRVFEYPREGLMRISGLGRSLKRQLTKAYDLVFYVNTLQTGLCFENIVAIARKCGKKVYEYQAGQRIREIKPAKQTTGRIYSCAS